MNLQWDKMVWFHVFSSHGLGAAQEQVPCKLRVRVLPGRYRRRRMRKGICNVLIRMTNHRFKPDKEKWEDKEEWSRMKKCGWANDHRFRCGWMIAGVMLPKRVTWKDWMLWLENETPTLRFWRGTVNDRRILSRYADWRYTNEQFAYSTSTVILTVSKPP